MYCTTCIIGIEVDSANYPEGRTYLIDIDFQEEEEGKALTAVQNTFGETEICQHRQDIAGGKGNVNGFVRGCGLIGVCRGSREGNMAFY